MSKRRRGSRGRFYNTIHLRGKDLERAEREADTQEERVLIFFLLRPGRYFTRDHILDYLNGPPISSVTRAMSNLADDGYILKVPPEEKPMAMGRFGKPIH
ncbi:MAG: hypothetical protein HRJ53_09535, partial [Acidobacteria bacterium Pan2503]|nr:hypothetical protein [Candidatus Acidoferrum panamensis]